MASGPRRASPPAGGASHSNRLHLHGIRELPSGHDPEIAAIFRDMRFATGLTVAETARRLETTERTIEALEEGTLLALPEWPETSRIVMAYAGLLGLDARPMLRRIHAQLVPPPPLRPSAPQGDGGHRERVGSTTPPQAASRRDRPRGRYRRLRALAGVVKWALLLSLCVGIGYGTVAVILQPRLVYTVIESLPEPLPRLARIAIELLRPTDGEAPRADNPAR